MTRYYLDTEFNEDGRTIELISLALVREDGESLYVVSNEFDPAACNNWVQTYVLPKLPPKDMWVSRASIRRQLVLFLSRGCSDIDAAATKYGKPEIWAYFADYDWVVFCQLFGRMVDLPSGLPMYCRDLKQLMDERGIPKSELPTPDPARAHDALADAEWVRRAHQAIRCARLSDDELANLIRRVVAEADRTGPEGIAAVVQPLRDAGITANMNMGTGAQTSRRAKLEWYAGQILNVVDTEAWPVMNSVLNAAAVFTT